MIGFQGVIARHPEGHVLVAVLLCLGRHPLVEGRAFIDQARALGDFRPVGVGKGPQGLDLAENFDPGQWFGAEQVFHTLQQFPLCLLSFNCGNGQVFLVFRDIQSDFGNQFGDFKNQFRRINACLGRDFRDQRGTASGCQRIARGNGQPARRQCCGNELGRRIEGAFHLGADGADQVFRATNPFEGIVYDILDSHERFVGDMDLVAGL